jgi:hypothetical protein
LKTIIHVNRSILAKNLKTGERNPAIAVKTYKKTIYAKKIKIGNLYFVQDEDNPLACGARVWAYIEGPENIVEVLG